jgi:hypothetical protein
MVVVFSFAARAQMIADVPEPSAGEARPQFVLEYLEAPEQIALGTMSVNVWARIAAEESRPHVTGATLVLLEEEREGERIEMLPVDGAFDSSVEEVVGTIDTYTWVRDAVHPFEIRVRGAEVAPVAVGRGTVRVKPRVSTPDLFLFDRDGSARAWTGSGAGGFTPGAILPTGVPIGLPVLADLDDDDRLDLVVAGTRGELRVGMNGGGGRFEPGRSLAIGRQVAASAVGDLDGDGKPDLVTASRGRGLTIRLGLAEGPAQVTPLEGLPDALALADANGDGADEIFLALLDMYDTRIRVWRRESGEEPAWAPQELLEPPLGSRGRIRVMRRARGPASGADRLLILTGEGAEGMLESWDWPADTQGGSKPASSRVLRLPGEPLGAVDGAFGFDGGPGWLVVVREARTGAALAIPETGSPARLATGGEFPVAFAALDLDGDGDDDLVTGGKDLRVWINVRGAFREAGESPYVLDTPVVALLSGNLDDRSR